MSDYAFPGTDQIAQNALDVIEDRMAVLLANHGVIALGGNVEESLKVAHLVEHLSRIYLLSHGAGSIRPIPKSAFLKQRDIFKERTEKTNART